MKKVRSPKDIKVLSGRSARNTAPFVGGDIFNDYLLDLMKLK